MINYTSWYRPSSNGECEIYSRLYTCENPKAIVQIAHGMSEHSGRYKTFMEFLANNGYIVCTNDHLGHGKSALTSHAKPGLFSLQAGGFSFMIEDIHTLFQEVDMQYPKLPKILIGQSMGSILAALFADQYTYLSKLVLMGTPAYNKVIDLFAFMLTKSVKKYGFLHTSKLYNRVIWGTIPKERKRQQKHFSWLCSDDSIVSAFLDDPLCGHLFYDSANLEMFSGLKKWGNDSWGDNIREIPVLFLVGNKDKIAGYGKGTKHYFNVLSKKNPHAELRIINGNRHEVLNETSYKETYQYLLNWLNLL